MSGERGIYLDEEGPVAIFGFKERLRRYKRETDDLRQMLPMLIAIVEAAMGVWESPGVVYETSGGHAALTRNRDALCALVAYLGGDCLFVPSGDDPGRTPKSPSKPPTRAEASG